MLIYLQHRSQIELGEQTPSWNVCGCLGEIYLCIFWQKLFSRSVQSQISDCLHSLLVLFCIFLPFSIRVHYLPFILFFHSVTASGSLFSAYNVFISYVYYHTSSLASHFCDYIDTYSLWLDLARLIFEYFQHILKIFFFFFYSFWYSTFLGMYRWILKVIPTVCFISVVLK